MTNTYRAPVREGDQIRAGLAAQMVSLAAGVAVADSVGDDGTKGRRSSQACRARWLSMYLAHVGYGWPLERVGHAFGVNRATVGAGCRWAEDARDHPAVDGLLDRLETALRDICEAPRIALADIEVRA